MAGAMCATSLAQDWSAMHGAWKRDNQYKFYWDMAGHNSWSAEARFPVKSMSNVHRDYHRQLSKKIEITTSIYELVTLRGGGKHPSAWVHFKHSCKSGDVVEIPVSVAFGINGQNKITYEWAFYDSSQLPANSPCK